MSEAQRPLAHDELRDVVELTLHVGQLLLRSGAQTSRVERTMRKVAAALGAEGVDVLVVPEGLALTTSSGAEFRTRVRRVEVLGVNLAQLARLDELGARVVEGSWDRRRLREELRRLDDAPPRYSRPLVSLAVGLACAAFCRNFGGDARSFFITWCAASLAMTVRQALTRAHYNPVLVVIPTAFVAALLPALAHRLGLLPEPAAALAASVLLLVPGVPLINAGRDIVRGHVATGTARGTLGLVWALCIAIGIVLALELLGVRSFVPAVPAPRALLERLSLDAAWSAVAALGFAVLFETPRSVLPACALLGAFGHSLHTFLSSSGASPLLGTIAGAASIGLLAEGCARVSRIPAGVFSIPAAIPLVPGVSAFRSMLALLGLGRPEQRPEPLALEALTHFASTGLTLAGLALGIALPALLLRRE